MRTQKSAIMNKFKYYFIFLIITASLFSCTKTDEIEPAAPPRDFALQYATDNTDIEEYLKTNYITVINHAGFVDDQNVTISKITAGKISIWDQKTYELKSRDVSLHDIIYKVYYLVLRQGVGSSPSNVDGVLAAYHGEYLQRKVTTGTEMELTSTLFEETLYPQQFFSLLSTISGWAEIFPKFKTGTNTSNADGTVNHLDFGAGVMFLPSGLGYFSSGSGNIPSYSPLVFSFKLFEIQRLDQDLDGIPSYLEDINGDNYLKILATGVVNPDDSDLDGIPNFLDVDDDGDGYTTKLESKRPDLTVNSLPVSNGYYPFTGASVDDPLTPNIDERQGIPSCSSDFTTPTRLRKYLDKSCH